MRDEVSVKKIVEYVKAVDKHNLSYNNHGHLVIRTKQYTEEKPFNITRLEVKKDLLKNKLLFPEDRIVRKPINKWVDELLTATKEIVNLPRQTACAAKIAEIFNNASFIYYCINEVMMARELCYTQIQLFIDWSRHSNDQALLKYIFQPWINLCRLDREERSYQSVIDKMTLLNIIDKSEIVIGNNRIYTHALRSVLDIDSDVKAVVDTCKLLEPIKAYLQAKKYSQVIQFIENNRNNVNKMQNAILQEASAIALANTGNIRESLALLTHAKNHFNPALMHIFQLRECEIKQKIGGVNNLRYDLRALSSIALTSISTQYININDIIFGLHTADIMKSAGLKKEAIELSYFCLVAADKINDALLKTESLVLLYELMQKSKGKKLIEKLMTEHYESTSYVSARKRMLNIFPELNMIDTHNHEIQINSLFHELSHLQAYISA